MFCPKCKSIMMPKMDGGKRQLVCSCGYKERTGSVTLKETNMQKGEPLSVVEKEETTNIIVDADCPKCGPKKAEYWEIQTRSADEPPTRFYKCTNCNHTWREYK